MYVIFSYATQCFVSKSVLTYYIYQEVFATCQKKEHLSPAVKAHIDKLLDETFQNRRQMVNDPPNMEASQLVEKLWTEFPCFQDDIFVS